MIRSLRHILVAFLIVGATAALGAGTAGAAGAAAGSKPPCWKVLINDWYDGRIDGTYEIHCYRDALEHLPADVDTYSSARDDIRQALQKRITQSHASNGGGTTGGGTTGGGASGGGASGSGSSGGGSSGGSGTSGGGSSDGGNGSAGGPIPNAINNLGPKKADSLPVPLLVLGGVAVALMAAGGAGFLARRTRTRRAQLASAASVPHGSGPGPGEQS